MIAYNASGQEVTLGEPLAQGGEAIVYRLQDDPDSVAKLYVPAPRRGYEDKVEWMHAHRPAADTGNWDHPMVAWPSDMLYNRRRQFVGYLMPFVRNAVPLLQAYSPRLRLKALPHFDARYRYRAASNLARVLARLHEQGYVVGDLNESNILVSPDARVTIIDVDSFQVRTARGLHPCPVGKAEYLPPELQGRKLSRTKRELPHDYFALAVLIFKLLMDGRHPFQGRWLRGDEPPALEEKIARGWFPYTPRTGRFVAPPLHAPSLDTLDPGLAALIRRCFNDGHRDPAVRPPAEAWERALQAAEANLRPCQRGHYVSTHLAHCPGCGASPALFPLWLYRFTTFLRTPIHRFAGHVACTVREVASNRAGRAVAWQANLPDRSWWITLTGINHPWLGAVATGTLALVAMLRVTQYYPNRAASPLPALPLLLIAFAITTGIGRLLATVDLRPNRRWHRSIHWGRFDWNALGRMFTLNTILLPITIFGIPLLSIDTDLSVPALAAYLLLIVSSTTVAIYLKRRRQLQWPFTLVLALSLIQNDLSQLLAASLLLHGGLLALHAPVWLGTRLRVSRIPAQMHLGRGIIMVGLWLLLAAVSLTGKQGLYGTGLVPLSGWSSGYVSRAFTPLAPIHADQPLRSARVVNVAPARLNVRREPDLGTAVVATLQEGTEVEIIDRRQVEGMLWQHIRVKEIEGWVSALYLEEAERPEG